MSLLNKTYDGAAGTAKTDAGLEGHATRSDMTRVALASAMGTTIEYYDFTLYATASALVFNKTFFPTGNAVVGTLAAFATFFIGYCARPLGGIIFGHFGDKVGRKAALLTTIMIMGVGTFLIGLVPDYSQIGIFAPIALVVLRLLQGIGIGGEYGGGMTMTVEHAPPAQRGFYSSLVNIGVPGGFLIPIVLLGVLSNSMDAAAFQSWGWRIPFFLSAILVALGVFIRVKISESPAFKRVVAQGSTATVPVADAVRHHSRNIIFGIGAKIAESGLFNVYAVFVITYCVTVMHLPKETILNGILVGCALECFTLPIFGWLSDRIGRQTVYVVGMVFQAILALFFFQLLNTAETGYIWLAIALGLALGHGCVYGAQGAYFAELFPPRIRYSGLSLVQQIGPLLGGGLSPLISTALLAAYGSAWAVAAYMVAMALFSAACTIGLRREGETLA